jgi:hypothetical protein
MREAVVREGFARLRAWAIADDLAAKRHGAAHRAAAAAAVSGGRSDTADGSDSEGELMMSASVMEEFRLSMRQRDATANPAACAGDETSRRENPAVTPLSPPHRRSTLFANIQPTEACIVRARSAKQLICAEKELGVSAKHLFPANRAPVPSEAFAAELHLLRSARGC